MYQRIYLTTIANADQYRAITIHFCQLGLVGETPELGKTSRPGALDQRMREDRGDR